MADMIRQVVRARGQAPGRLGAGARRGGQGLGGGRRPVRKAGAARDADPHGLGDREAGAGHTLSTGTGLLAAAFSQARPRLVRVAYVIISSHSEAGDVVADCWFRLAAADPDEPVRDLGAWAIVAVSRMALDVLRSARVRRERYAGPKLGAVAEDQIHRVWVSGAAGIHRG